jgi:hypothetical protein
MADPQTLDDLLAVHAICRLKHRYLRCVDLKRWDELATCLTEDAEASYGGGAKELSGRDEILAFMEKALGSTRILTSHRAGQPEIDLLGPDEATGTWALEDVVIHQDHGLTIHGACFYEDRYLRVDGAWRIRETRYRRTYEEMWPRSSVAGLELTADLWATGGRSGLYGGL